MATFYVTTDVPFEGLTSDLGYWLWNVLLVMIPYDTGNLRSSFKMRNNSTRRISFIFDDAEAYYVDYLEEGIGFVKKYKDFIKRDMFGTMLSEVIYFVKTGRTGLITSKPHVELRESQYGSPIGYENKILKYHGEHARNITATDRKHLSQIMYRSMEDKNISSMSGRRPDILKNYKTSQNLNLNYFYIGEKEALTF